MFDSSWWQHFYAFCVRQGQCQGCKSNAPGCCCVRQGKIKSLEQIYLFSLPVKEYQIVEAFLGSALKDEVMKIMPVQKQTRAGQRTRFKARHLAPMTLPGSSSRLSASNTMLPYGLCTSSCNRSEASKTAYLPDQPCL